MRQSRIRRHRDRRRRLLVATPTEHPDLFWAVRGGRANLGVVTSFEYRLHEVGPVLGGGIAWPLARAKHVLPFYDEFARACPDELSLNAGLFTVEDGTRVVGVNVAWIGPVNVGERLLKPLRSLDSPIADGIVPMSYVDLQRGGDGRFSRGRRHYWKASFLRRLEQGTIDVLVEFAATCPSPYTQVGLQQMHGQAGAGVPDGDGVRASSRPVGLSHADAVGRSRRRRAQHSLDARAARRTAAVDGGRGLREPPR